MKTAKMVFTQNFHPNTLTAMARSTMLLRKKVY